MSTTPGAYQKSPETSAEIRKTAAAIVDGVSDPRLKAIRIYEFVRDRISFGFTQRFDAADPAYTLEIGRGHCNPQTELVVALMRAVGLDARQRFVTIDSQVLDGLFPKRAKPPQELNHSYAEVLLDGQWIRIDGYIVDPDLFAGAQSRLAETGQRAGFGAHAEGCNEWDGRSDCMSQFVGTDLLRREHPLYEPARRFYRSDAYTQRMGPVVRFFYQRFGVSAINERIEEVRALGTVSLPPF